LKTAHQLYERHQVDPISNTEIEDFVDKLGLANAAILAGDEKFIREISGLLSEAEVAFVDFRRAQLSNDFDIAQNQLKVCVESSRKSSSRNHLLEARARMEWGLLRFTQGEIDEAGIDLRWAMERLKVISEGSAEHGLAIINMAAWHLSRNESMMALAQLSQIDRLGPHKIEIIAASRLQIAKILFEIGDYKSSQRHAWVAFQGFRSSNMVGGAIEAALIWLDLSINKVSKNATLMSEIVENASPRNLGDNNECSSHPEDVVLVIEWCANHWEVDFSGPNRPDLMVMLEAENSVGLKMFSSKLTQENNIEDPEVLKMLNQ
jgi:transcriptional regulator CtsR